jgi:hypothetical protein
VEVGASTVTVDAPLEIVVEWQTVEVQDDPDDLVSKLPAWTSGAAKA